MERLGKNQAGYLGERIDCQELLEECRTWAVRHGWQSSLIPPGELGREAYWRHSRTPGAPAFFLSAGIHGDEPAGPVAVRNLLQENEWPDAHLWLIPCLNPAGFALGTRENAEGIDLNRDFLNPRSPEVIGQIAWMEPLPRFDLTLLLHEDWEANGFYCYELNLRQRPSLAPAMVAGVRPVCPIETAAEVDGRPTDSPGIIRPNPDLANRPLWPEAVWLAVHKTDLNYTLEAPSDWPLPVRVAALTKAVRAALGEFVESTWAPKAPRCTP